VHIELAALMVDDYDTAIKFFVRALGFDLVKDSPSLINDGRPKRWVVVRPPGAATGLQLAKADGPAQTRAVGDQFAGRAGFFPGVDDFDDAFRRMASAGVESVTEPPVEAYGRVAVFLDVAGSRWDLLG
jgi:catechol 2,3-dioxygenase-like lactoylglutathione lyase family enzyme